MKKISSLGRILGCGVLALGILLATADYASAQNPFLPRLKLIADNPTPNGPVDINNPELGGGNATFYPDGRIWVPRSHEVNNEDGTRFLLVPVLVKNGWVNTRTRTVEGIRSFKFKMQYSGQALRAVGVQKVGPCTKDTFALAKDFQLEFSDAEDPSYLSTLNPDIADPSGRRVIISGSSSRPLPPSPSPIADPDPEDRIFVELLYVRFQVIAESGNVGDNTPLILTNDTLQWNDRRPTEQQFVDANPPGIFGGLDGINNSQTLRNETEPTRPGVAYVRVSDVPKLEFAPTIGPNAIVREIAGTNGAQWELLRPLEIDSASFAKGGPNTVSLTLDVINGVNFSRLTKINVESDAPWLQFNTVGDKTPINGPTRQGFIDFIDEEILGGRNPMNELTVPDPTLVMEIIVDPLQLPDESPAGLYFAHITFTTESAQISPVRLRVPFMMFRNPIEPNVESDVLQQNQIGCGIRLTVENSAEIVERTTMIFGTGVRATNGIDPLFAESEHDNPLGAGFGARWFPIDRNGDPVTQNGLDDMSIRSASKDIRNANSDTTLIYFARFSAGAEENYPIIISWDTRDFPEGAQLFLRDSINGTIFSTDMRNATQIGPTRFAFTIEDARITSFIIEYTFPTVERFPVIEKGWNFISLPLRPGNPDYRTVYPNALDKPRFFSANGYPEEENLRFGIGYFVKYGNLLDDFIAGIRVSAIGKNTPYRVRVSNGWNSIGALSFPTSIDNITFSSIDDVLPAPERDGAIYRYDTDRGYQEVSILEPGLGHWLKVNDSEGFVEINFQKAAASNNGVDQRGYAIDNSDKISIRDFGQREGELYVATKDLGIDLDRFQLPPVPPVGMFDVRFSDGRYIDHSDNAVIEIQGAEYPLVLTMDNPEADYVITNPANGAVLGTFTRGESGAVRVDDQRVGYLKLTATGVYNGEAYYLDQNFPNPASGKTIIDFALQQKEFVTITLYNSLGQEVTTLANGMFTKGVNSIDVDVTNLESGSYVYRIKAGDFVATRSMVIVK